MLGSVAILPILQQQLSRPVAPCLLPRPVETQRELHKLSALGQVQHLPVAIKVEQLVVEAWVNHKQILIANQKRFETPSHSAIDRMVGTRGILVSPRSLNTKYSLTDGSSYSNYLVPRSGTVFVPCVHI